MSRMALIIVRSLLLAMVATLYFAAKVLAGCDFAEDSQHLISLNFGKIELSGFRAGDLSVTAGKALANGDEWNFKLDPRNRHIRVSIAAKFTPGLRIAGTLYLARPITGYVSERITGGACKRTLRLVAETLRGSGLEVSQGILNTRLGTKTEDLAGQVLRIRDQSEIVDGPDGTSGTVDLSVANVALAGASIVLGTPDLSYVTALGSTGRVQASLDVNLLLLHFVNATFHGGRFQAGDDDPLVIGPLSLAEPKITGHSTEVSYQDGNASVAVGADIGYSSLSLTSGITLVAGPGAIQNARLTAKAGDGKLTGLEVEKHDLSLTGGRASFSAVSVALPGGGVSNGDTEVAFTNIATETVDYRLEMSSPQLTAFFPSTFGMVPLKIAIGVAGSVSAPNVSASMVSDALAVGAAELMANGLQLDARFLSNGDAELSVAIPSSTLRVPSIMSSSLGVVSAFSLRATASSDPARAYRKVVIPAKGLTGRLALTETSVPTLGGLLKYAGVTTQLSNETEMRFADVVSDAFLPLGKTTVDLIDPQIELTPGQAITTIAGVSRAKQAQFGLSLDPENAGLRALASFDLPGFVLQPPSPITSIRVTLGGLDIDVNGVRLGGIHVELDLKAIRVSLNGFGLGLGKFAPHHAGAGDPAPPLDLSGEAATPFSIATVMGTFSIVKWPIKLSVFDVYGLHFEAKNLAYHGPSNLNTTAERATIDVASLHLPQNSSDKAMIDASLLLANAPVSWSGAPNGSATMERLFVRLLGDPAAPNGSIEMAIRNVDINGRADVPLGTKPDGTHGCEIHVPANVGFHIDQITGKLVLTNGVSSDTLSGTGFNIGRIDYAGHQECNFNQPVVLASFTISYPCIGTWSDPVRTCTETIEPKFDIDVSFTVKAIVLQIEPKEIRFKLSRSGSVDACFISISKMFPLVPPIWSIAPQIPVGGDVARIINDLISVGFGSLESTITVEGLDLYSKMTLFGFGEANPIKSVCNS